MKEIVYIFLSMLAVYGFYAALRELRTLFLRLSHRDGKKIDKEDGKEYNSTNQN